jgi:hypothetical protein
MRARQIHRPRTKRVIPLRGRSRPGLFPRPFARLVIAVLIPMLTVFCCHSPSQARGPYCLPDTPRPASKNRFP